VALLDGEHSLFVEWLCSAERTAATTTAFGEDTLSLARPCPLSPHITERRQEDRTPWAAENRMTEIPGGISVGSWRV
jgi:hypothetical protein